MSPAFSVATVPSGQKEDRDEGRTCLDERLRCKEEPFKMRRIIPQHLPNKSGFPRTI